MAVHCAQCAHLILDVDNRLPPWCSRCGADLKPGSATTPPAALAPDPILPPPDSRFRASFDLKERLPPETAAAREQPETIFPPAEEEEEGPFCPGCQALLEIPYGAEDLIISCPECGQCLKAPKPWTPTAAPGQSGNLCPPGVKPRPKYSGWVGIGVGSLMAAVGLIPGVEPWFQLAAGMIGGALCVEGTGRLFAEARKQQRRQKANLTELPQELLQEALRLGGLRAVFRTANRGNRSLVLFLTGLAFAFGEVGLLGWLKAGAFHPKLVLAAIMAPALALNLFYRAVRNLFESWQVLVFANGLLCIHGRRLDATPWEKVETVTLKEAGNAIDERAVEIRRKLGKPPFRFTCCHFPNLEQFYACVRQQLDSRTLSPGEGAEA